MGETSKLLVKLSQRLFEDPATQTQFVEALIHPKPFHPCILWTNPRLAEPPFEIEPPLPWQPEFVDRLALGVRPGQHALHQAGHFYCLDFSSVFAASVLLTLPQPTETVLDLCAAPGGKSIFASIALRPRQLISNEAIGKRIGALASNLKRCQIAPATILNCDSGVLAETMPEAANVVLVDAPCTGQSLLAKGGKAPGCFHPVSINKNANRQRRILANAASLVAPQGYLAYMTCAYSLEENEQVSAWFLSKFPQFQPLEVPHLETHRSHLAPFPCYRMFPQTRLGAGAFTILFQKEPEAQV